MANIDTLTVTLSLEDLQEIQDSYREACLLLDKQEEEIEKYKSYLTSFYTGNIPENGDLIHLVLSKWGRKRLDEMNTTPKILS